MDKVIDLNKYREAKMLSEIHKERQRQDYKPDDEEFIDRISTIRKSLERINKLVGKLKKISTDSNTVHK